MPTVTAAMEYRHASEPQVCRRHRDAASRALGRSSGRVSTSPPPSSSSATTVGQAMNTGRAM